MLVPFVSSDRSAQRSAGSGSLRTLCLARPSPFGHGIPRGAERSPAIAELAFGLRRGSARRVGPAGPDTTAGGRAAGRSRPSRRSPPAPRRGRVSGEVGSHRRAGSIYLARADRADDVPRPGPALIPRPAGPGDVGPRGRPAARPGGSAGDFDAGANGRGRQAPAARGGRRRPELAGPGGAEPRSAAPGGRLPTRSAGAGTGRSLRRPPGGLPRGL